MLLRVRIDLANHTLTWFEQSESHCEPPKGVRRLPAPDANGKLEDDGWCATSAVESQRHSVSPDARPFDLRGDDGKLQQRSGRGWKTLLQIRPAAPGIDQRSTRAATPIKQEVNAIALDGVFVEQPDSSPPRFEQPPHLKTIEVAEASRPFALESSSSWSVGAPAAKHEARNGEGGEGVT
ncbi:MAG: hypothetical protein ABI895_39080 [Deltaproteobacteria bacterium]